MSKLLALLDLFRKGNAVADPEAWKKRQIDATHLGALVLALLAVAKAFGYDLPMDSETVLLVGGGLFALVQWVLTLVTSEKVGVLPAKPEPPRQVRPAPGAADPPGPPGVSGA